MMPRPRPYVILALLWGAYFHPLFLHPNQTLYSDYSDMLAEHLPAKHFLNREWRKTGEVPRWSPLHYCGSPFIHDIQVGCFYPPYAVLYIVPEHWLGAALSWIVALHVLAAGWFAYPYARSHDLGELGSLVVAVGFMLSAKWMTHLLLAGHTITVGLAWLPLVLVGLERGIRSGGVWPVVGAGVAFALLLLGTHPQWAFYAGVFIAAWTLGSAERTRHGMLRWLRCGLGVAAIAVLLTAVQLLPTWEASGQSARAIGLQATGAVQVGIFSAFALVGPSSTYDIPQSWEQRGLFGCFWLAAAAAAPYLVRGRTKWYGGVLLGLFVFSFGGSVFVEWLPGFRLFRLPPRMLLIAAFPVAFLAGVATDHVVRRAWDGADRKQLGIAFLGVFALAVVPTLGYIGATRVRAPGTPLWGCFIAYWVAFVVALPAFLALVLSGDRFALRVRNPVWLAILLVDLVAPIAVLPEVRPEEEIYARSRAVNYLHWNMTPGQNRVYDWDVNEPGSKVSALGIGDTQAIVYGFESVRGYNPLDVRHYREFVGFIADLDEPVVGLSPVAQPVLSNFPIVNRPLFDLLGVKYLVIPVAVPAALQLDLRTVRPIGIDPGEDRSTPIPANAPVRLPTYAIVENPGALPRAFVVPDAAAMPGGRERAALQATDFRKTVLLTTDAPLPPNGSGPGRTARIIEYGPNRIAVDLAGGARGVLVLADVWFPGWTCRVDGVEVPIHRANHAFRAVAIPEGAQGAVFSFEPASYRIGWWVSAASLGVLAFACIGRTGNAFRLRGRVWASRK